MTAEGGSPLTPGQLQRLDEALKQVLELPEHERQAWVDSSFPDSPRLRDALTNMLSSDPASAAYFDAASAQRDQIADQLRENQATGTHAGQLIGSMIGKYRLESLVASGGMGAVYRATRADGEFDQTVAVKILPGWATDPVTVSIANEPPPLPKLPRMWRRLARMSSVGKSTLMLPFTVLASNSPPASDGR